MVSPLLTRLPGLHVPGGLQGVLPRFRFGYGSSLAHMASVDMYKVPRAHDRAIPPDKPIHVLPESFSGYY